MHLENFMSRPDVIPTFRQRRCTNRGRNFARSKQQPPYMSSTTFTCFCALTIRKHLPKVDFERSGRGQEPSRGHKFSILENVVLHWDFTSSMRLHFRGDLVGVALVGAKPLHLLTQTVPSLKSPTGAFIASQTLIFRKKQIIRTHLLSETSSDYFCLVRVARIELTAS